MDLFFCWAVEPISNSIQTVKTMANSSLISKIAILFPISLAMFTPLTASAQVTRHWTPIGTSNNWHDANNWTPAGVPGILDDVVHDNGQRTISLANGPTSGIDSMIISQSARLFTSGNTLNINAVNNTGLLHIIGSGSELVVEPSTTPSPDADVDSVDIEIGGKLRMAGGDIRIDREMAVDTSSRIAGFGNVHFDWQDEMQMPNVLSVEGTIQPTDGLLTITAEEFATIDIADAQIDAGFGNLRIDAEQSENFAGTLTVRNGHFVDIRKKMRLSSDSVVNLFGGQPGDEAAMINAETAMQARVNVSGSTSMHGLTLLSGEAEVVLPSPADRLRISGALGVFSNSGDDSNPAPTFSGLGILEIDSDSDLILINYPVFDATVVNSGRMNVVLGGFLFSSEVGAAEFNTLVQTNEATLHYDIGILVGEVFGDVYLANGIVQLDGRLEVSLVDIGDAGLPELNAGDSFQIISSTVGVFGQFSEVVLPPTPEGLHWQLSYSANSVDLELTDLILGDVNGDGQVDLLDISPFVETVTSGIYTPSADINQDTVVDLLDVEPFIDLIVG